MTPGIGRVVVMTDTENGLHQLDIWETKGRVAKLDEWSHEFDETLDCAVAGRIIGLNQPHRSVGDDDGSTDRRSNFGSDAALLRRYQDGDLFHLVGLDEADKHDLLIGRDTGQSFWP